MSEEEYVHYDADIIKHELFQLTLTRGMLNEVMNILSANNHVAVTVNDEGHIGFDIPSDSEVSIRSINIIQDMVDMIAVLDGYIEEEKNDEQLKILYNKKSQVLSAIEIVSDIITYDGNEGDNDVEQEKPIKDS